MKRLMKSGFDGAFWAVWQVALEKSFKMAIVKMLVWCLSMKNMKQTARFFKKAWKDFVWIWISYLQKKPTDATTWLMECEFFIIFHYKVAFCLLISMLKSCIKSHNKSMKPFFRNHAIMIFYSFSVQLTLFY